MSYVKPALQIAGTLIKPALQNATGLSKEYFQYDFVGLLVKLLVYFAVALIAGKYFELTNGLSNLFGGFLGLLGVKVPQNANMFLAKLFSTQGILFDPTKPTGQNGISGFNYWRFVQFGAIAMVTWEALKYYNMNKGNLSAITIGVFTIIIFFLTLTTIPDLFQKIKESNILKQVAK